MESKERVLRMYDDVIFLRNTTKPERIVKQLKKVGCNIVRKCKKHYAIMETPKGTLFNMNQRCKDYHLKCYERILSKEGITVKLG